MDTAEHASHFAAFVFKLFNILDVKELPSCIFAARRHAKAVGPMCYVRLCICQRVCHTHDHRYGRGHTPVMPDIVSKRASG